jgi:predicted regulator of Ras-like GTPase activity (Roadblock/LC7/MglB family)
MTYADERFAPEIVTIGTAALERIRQSAGSLALALLLSDDGFEVTRTPSGGESDGRFASISSSVQALGEAVVAELSAGHGEAVIVQATQGFVVQMRVPDQPYVVAAHFRMGDNLGTALSLVRLSSQEIGDALASLARQPSATVAARYSAPIVPEAPVLQTTPSLHP